MVSSSRLAIACVLFILSAGVSSYAQTNPAASISGKVMMKKKPVSGIVIMARQPNRERTRYRATTDDKGSYRITNLPAGAYQVSLMTMSLVQENDERHNVLLNDGEAVEDIDFALVPGAVITGKITDSDGRPLIEEIVSIWPIQLSFSTGFYGMSDAQTDDRGVYRAFGLRPGKYRVSVGQLENRLTRGRQSYERTFYPSVTDMAKSALIEVTEGSEANNIDIVVGRSASGFKVTGRIVDSETGKPIPNVNYGINQLSENGSISVGSGLLSNANGEFKFENVLPGKYSVFISAGDENIRADRVPFEVIDRDVAGLLVKTTKGGSISGVVVFEGFDEASIGKIRDLYLEMNSENPEFDVHDSIPVHVQPDRTFRRVGLPAGLVSFDYILPTSISRGRFAVARIERDGVEQPRGIVLKDGEQVAGVRVVVKYLNGTIRGEVKLEDIELPANSHMSVWAELVGENRVPGEQTHDSSASVDARNRFLIEGLAAGVYQVNVAIFDPNRRDGYAVYKQQVTVTDNAVSEVTVSVKPKP